MHLDATFLLTDSIPASCRGVSPAPGAEGGVSVQPRPLQLPRILGQLWPLYCQQVHHHRSFHLIIMAFISSSSLWAPETIADSSEVPHLAMTATKLTLEWTKVILLS